jgi:hypothetical protein
MDNGKDNEPTLSALAPEHDVYTKPWHKMGSRNADMNLFNVEANKPSGIFYITCNVCGRMGFIWAAEESYFLSNTARGSTWIREGFPEQQFGEITN